MKASARRTHAPDVGTGAGRPTVPGIVHRVLRTPGQALDPAVRGVMQPRFAHDLSHVRVHADALAGASAQAVRAQAYTVGRHVVFAPGAYESGRLGDLPLLAHELTHVGQQTGAPPARRDDDLEVAPSGGAAEAAAVAATSGGPRLRRPMLQRAEHGTYVSKHGPKEFLDAGAAYYQHWGHANVRRVSTLDDVLTDLDRGRGDLDRVRIVSHAVPSGLMLGLTSTMSPTFLDTSALEFGTPARFRTALAEVRLVSDAVYTRVVGILQADAATKPAMTTLGAATGTPATTSPLGILLRSIVEARFVADARLADGSAPTITNRTILDQFNSSRQQSYRALVLDGMEAAQRTAGGQAIDRVIAELPAALGRATFAFNAVSQDEADQMADPLLDPNASAPQLDPRLATQIREGAGRGTFLSRLGRIRARVGSSTQIEIRGCQIGQNAGWMQAFRSFVGPAGNLPGLSAPDLFQYFFPLNFRIPAPADADTDLATTFADPTTGLATDFALQQQVRQGDAIPVSREETTTNAGKPTEVTAAARFVARYGLAARGIGVAELKRLNPEIRDWGTLAPGTMLHLRARRVPVAPSTSLEEFAQRVFGDRLHWPQVWSYNPQLAKPALSPSDTLWLQSAEDRAKFGEAKEPAGLPELKAHIAKGEAVAAIETTQTGETRPVLRMDPRQATAAMGRWLAGQRFDPQGRTAEVLSRLFAGGQFKQTALRLHMMFLSRSFPNIVDPIFPDDPRFAAHVIRMP